MAKYFAGLDIGGTTIKSVLVDAEGEITGETVEVRSRVTEGYGATFDQLEEALKLLAAAAGVSRAEIKGAGLDVPAPSSNGVIWGRANLADDWVGVNIRDEFSKRAGFPVYMTNDGNAAALGEYAVRKKSQKGLLLVAPGTGLGGGLVLPGGRMYEGSNGLALEVGHVSVPFREENGELPPCTCGKKGCTEAWVSLIALRRRVKIELSKPEWQEHPLNRNGTSVEEKAFKLRDYAEKNDRLAVSIFKQQGFILGYALADFVRLFDPGLVVLGGGLAEMTFRDRYLEWVYEGFSDRAWPMYEKSPIEPEKTTTDIEWAMGGDAAAAIGMAFVSREMFG